MYKKILIILVLICNSIGLVSGCSYISYKDYYTNISDYSEVWELPGFYHTYDGISPFFPENIENVDVQEFFCRYDQQLPIGEGIQIFLEIQYSDEKPFDVELERIRQLSHESDQYFNNVELDAYSMFLGVEYSSEYALVDMEERIIYYIYLQNLPKAEIEFDQSLLPDGYDGFGEIKT